MRIQHNIPALSAYRNYTNNQSALAKNLEKLSSGYKINRAGDDAAGLAISEKMRAQITGLEVAQKNAKDGISLVQTAEGALTEVHDMLNRMYELAEQSRNGTYDSEVDRAQMQKEIESLKTEIDRIAESANFNGIKLLDGMGGSGSLAKVPVEFSTISTTEGVTVDSVAAGKGTKGTFVIDVDQLFGTGDKITFEGNQAATTVGMANGPVLNVTLTYDGNISGTNKGKFNGTTKEEQAQSIADALGLEGNIVSGFDIAVDGSKVILTSKSEGLDGAKLNKVSVGDQTLALGTITDDDGVSSSGNKAINQFKGLFSQDGVEGNNNKSGFNAGVGDTVKFTLKDASGKSLTVSVKITQDMMNKNGAYNAKTTGALTANFVEVLKNAHFDDIEGTGVDESQLKVSDLFNVKANNQINSSSAEEKTAGSITFENVVAGVQAPTGMSAEIWSDGSKVGLPITAVAGKAGTDGGSPAAEKHTIAVPTEADANFTAGDIFTISGTLSDGQKFEVNLKAGEDFEIKSDYKATMAEIVKVLTGKEGAKALDKDKIADVTVGGKTVKADTIFGGTSATAAGVPAADIPGLEFKVNADASGVLTIESTRKGLGGVKGSTNTIKEISVATAKEASINYTPTAALNKQAAVSSFTLDDSITKQYGTAIEIGDKVYEIVADARDVASRNNVAVVVEDLANSSASDVAQKLAQTIRDQDPNYDVYDDKTEANLADTNKTKRINTVDVKGSTITLTSVKKGSDAAAINISTPYGDKVTVASFEFDTSVVDEHSKLQFNGNTYEFIKKGGIVENEGAIAIEIDDFAKATAKSLGDAFANVAKNGTVTVDDNGKITLKGVEAEDGTLSKPSVKFDNNLILQIGDTADEFNQMTVTLSDCHSEAIGVGDVDISTQEGAKDAMDAIKDAINYVSDVRGTLGATQNRLDHTINNLSVMQENIQDAESSIRDVDVAKEMMDYTKNNILVQSAQAMLAQANQLPQGVLQLLQ